MKVFGELSVDSQQLLMVTIATSLLEIGYEVQVNYILVLHFGLNNIYGGKIPFEFREKKRNREPAK